MPPVPPNAPPPNLRFQVHYNPDYNSYTPGGGYGGGVTVGAGADPTSSQVAIDTGASPGASGQPGQSGSTMNITKLASQMTPEDFIKLAQAQSGSSQANIGAQTVANRPTQESPFGRVGWTTDEMGRLTQNVNFGGQLGSTNEALQQQAYINALRGVGTGEDARNQAITSAYNQATSRLDPAWKQRESATEARLANQGLAPGSAAYRNAMLQQGQQRNDAYGGAMANAIGQGTSAAQGVFGMNLAAQQLPYQQMGQMRGLLQPFGFNAAGAAAPTDYLTAGSLATHQGLGQQQLQQQAAQNQQQNEADIWGTAAKLAGTVGSLFL